jgi:hypothetical protein
MGLLARVRIVLRGRGNAGVPEPFLQDLHRYPIPGRSRSEPGAQRMPGIARQYELSAGRMDPPVQDIGVVHGSVPRFARKNEAVIRSVRVESLVRAKITDQVRIDIDGSCAARTLGGPPDAIVDRLKNGDLAEAGPC